MARFFIDKQYNVGDTFNVPDSTRQHIMALRLNPDDRIEIFNGNGYSYLAQIKDINRKTITIAIIEKINYANNNNKTLNVIIDSNSHIENNIPSKITVTLAIGIISSDKMDLVIQKATELNVNRIVPLITKRTQQIASERLLKRKKHWQSIVISSSEQCGRNELLIIEDPVYFTDYLSTCNTQYDTRNNEQFIKKFILSPSHNLGLIENNTININNVEYISLTISKNKAPNDIVLLIGPEGGFTNEEVLNAINNKFTPLTLGKNVLRAETATIVAITTMQVLYNWCLFGVKTP